MKRHTPEHIKEVKTELEEWQAELGELQGLRPVQETCENLKQREIPQLEKDLKSLESAHPDLSHAAEEVSDLSISEVFGRLIFDLRSEGS